VVLGIVGVSALSLTGCVTVPTGPNVMALPGRGKSFEAFQYDDDGCRAYASSRVHPEARRANDSAVTGAAVGTVVGAATGAAIGAAPGKTPRRAPTRAGGGRHGGSAIAADETQYGRWSIQRRYDVAYVQCMYAKGNQVPLPRGARPAAAYEVPPPRRSNVPPPPSGRPPEPPPDAGY
jgi:hypothetical protein